MNSKKFLGKNVLIASKERIAWTFDNFEKVYISFSGGKDSTVMMHLVMEEAIKRNRKVGMFFLDWECQFELTIQHIRNMVKLYEDYLELYWVQLPILTNNSTSMFEILWKSWDNDKKNLWTRDKEDIAIKDESYFDFYYDGITFEEFTPLFGEWYSEGKSTACFVGIRTAESLNRYRAVARNNIERLDGKIFTVNITDSQWNIYPIYDWSTEDIWVYSGKFKKMYNKLYDRFHQAGLTIHQMRVDEPFGEEARRSLWLYQIIEPDTWAKFVSRMAGVNSGALYCKDKGSILGNYKATLPEGHTWQSFTNLILKSMPPKLADHYKNKIAVYLKWYMDRGYETSIPDEADTNLENKNKVPSWRKICKCVLRNDYWCRSLGFGITKSSNYQKYLDLMKRRRTEWGIY